jgi:hypothetical protein
MSDEGQLAALVALFEENGRVAAAFWDWRHRLMTFFFTGTAGALAAAAWLVTHHAARGYVAVPLAMAAGLAGVCSRLDRRVGSILKAVHTSGGAYEAQLQTHAAMTVSSDGTYAYLAHARSGDDPSLARTTMSHVLPRMYRITGVMMVMLVVIECLHPLRSS